MVREKVTSTSIKSVGFENNILEIEFLKTGYIYQYFEVPEEIYIRLMAAESKGAFFTKKIRNNYEFKKIEVKSSVYGS
jgi:hypothetical protein